MARDRRRGVDHHESNQGERPIGRLYDDAEVTQEIIEVEETDSEDDLSEVSMQSNGDVNKA